MDTCQIHVILFSALIQVSSLEQGNQNQAKSSLEQGQVSGGPAAHPHQNFCPQFSTNPAPGNRHANIRLGFMLKLGFVYSDFQYQSITDSSNREI